MTILEHHFPPSVAVKYGVDAAIFLSNICFWCDTNRAHNENYVDGHWWTYKTLKGFCEQYPYWTKSQIERIIRTCKENGLLLTGHFDENPMKRTTWYTLTEEGWALFENAVEEKSISEISEMEVGEPGNVEAENKKCNKDKDKNKKDITPYSPPEGGEPPQVKKRGRPGPDWELFERFWSAYPNKKAKERARRAWAKLCPDLELCRVMSAALERAKRSPEWQKDGGAYIPHPATWLNGRRWEDEQDPPDVSRETTQQVPLRGQGVTYL